MMPYKSVWGKGRIISAFVTGQPRHRAWLIAVRAHGRTSNRVGRRMSCCDCCMVLQFTPSTNDYWVTALFHGWVTYSFLLPHSGFPKVIKTREKLAEYLTVIIFTTSAQHAAVNFGQVGTSGKTVHPIGLGDAPTRAQAEKCCLIDKQTLHCSFWVN